MEKVSAYIVTIYKILINLFRISAGIMIIIFGLSIKNAALSLWGNNFIKAIGAYPLLYFFRHTKDASPLLTTMLALILIIFSIIEIYFIYKMLKGERKGAIGLLIMSIIWTPVEILFLAKFFILEGILGWAINIIIITLLIRMIMHWREYAKNPIIHIKKIRR